MANWLRPPFSTDISVYISDNLTILLTPDRKYIHARTNESNWVSIDIEKDLIKQKEELEIIWPNYPFIIELESVSQNECILKVAVIGAGREKTHIKMGLLFEENKFSLVTKKQLTTLSKGRAKCTRLL